MSQPLRRVFSSQSAASKDGDLLSGKKDKYNGLTVNEDSVVPEREGFTRQLKESMQKWESQGIRGVWLKLSERNAHLTDIVLREGKF